MLALDLGGGRIAPGIIEFPGTFLARHIDHVGDDRLTLGIAQFMPISSDQGRRRAVSKEAPVVHVDHENVEIVLGVAAADLLEVGQCGRGIGCEC